MTTNEITTQAIKLLTSQAGYNYSEQAITAKAEQGLLAGDAIEQGNERIVYVGGMTVQRERRGGFGEPWTVDVTMELTAAQRVGVLVQVAAQAGKVSTHTAV